MIKIKKIEKTLTSNFGIGKKTSDKIHKELGLNKRNSPAFLKKKHKEKIEVNYFKNKIGKELKLKIKNCIDFKKKIKTYANLKTHKIKQKILLNVKKKKIKK